MKRLALLAVPAALIVAAVGIVAEGSIDRRTPHLAPSHGQREARGAYARLPLAFEENRGQWDRRVDFLARGEGYGVFLTSHGAALSLRGSDAGVKPAVVHMGFPGARKHPSVEAASELPGKVNYLLGADRSKWRTNVPTYREIRYGDAWPGIDVAYYGRGGALEYDFRLAAGAKPDRIAVAFKGARGLRIDGRGDLVMKVAGRELRQLRPRAYQSVGGERRRVAARYALLARRRVGIRLGRYERSLPVVVDPVLLYSTYLGGGADDRGEGIAVDGAGSAYVTGRTASPNFPTQNPEQATNGGNDDAFVTKLDPGGSTRVYSTYLGGDGDDVGNGIAVDGAGNAYVTGETSSTDFPLQGPIDSTLAANGDVFVTKLNPSGSAHLYSTYLGAGGGDTGAAIAVDAAGNAYVTGRTSSSVGFPLVGAQQQLFGGVSDAFLTKFNPAGSAHVYSTYLGGTDSDGGAGVAVDGAGNAYVTGGTASSNFPTAAPEQNTYGGGTSDAFLTKFNPAGNAHAYSTYLGGTLFDFGAGVAVDAAGNAYVGGETRSPDFPTQSPQQPMYGGQSDAFVTKFNAAGSAHVYSTYLGGGDVEYGIGIAVDGGGNAFAVGYTESTDFPTQSPVQAAHAGGPDDGDAFVTQFNSAGSAHLFSTYLGGIDGDQAEGIAVDSAGSAYVTGITQSTDFPVQNPGQSTSGGNDDGFVAKLGEPAAAPPAETAPDTTAAVLSAFSLKPKVFRAAARGASIARRILIGTRVSYSLSEQATVTFKVQRAAKGRRVGGKCRRPTRGNRTRRRCVRYVTLRGSFKHQGDAGPNRFKFTGRLRGRKLRPRRYRLRARPVDLAGNVSRSAARKFRIVRR